MTTSEFEAQRSPTEKDPEVAKERETVEASSQYEREESTSTAEEGQSANEDSSGEKPDKDYSTKGDLPKEVASLISRALALRGVKDPGLASIFRHDNDVPQAIFLARILNRALMAKKAENEKNKVQCPSLSAKKVGTLLNKQFNQVSPTHHLSFGQLYLMVICIIFQKSMYSLMLISSK